MRFGEWRFLMPYRQGWTLCFLKTENVVCCYKRTRCHECQVKAVASGEGNSHPKVFLYIVWKQQQSAALKNYFRFHSVTLGCVQRHKNGYSAKAPLAYICIYIHI